MIEHTPEEITIINYMGAFIYITGCRRVPLGLLVGLRGIEPLITLRKKNVIRESFPLVRDIETVFEFAD